MSTPAFVVPEYDGQLSAKFRTLCKFFGNDRYQGRISAPDIAALGRRTSARRPSSQRM